MLRTQLIVTRDRRREPRSGHPSATHLGEELAGLARTAYGRAQRIRSHVRPFYDQIGYRLMKRVLDVVICLALLPLASVLMIAIALAIFLDSGRPILYNHERVGRGGRRFRVYKFRTLKPDYDSRTSRDFMKAFISGHLSQGDGNDDGRVVHKPFDKAHITRLGRILRKTSLDELPQILNVLKGEMSLVGPRPNVPWEVEAYRSWHTVRLEALPGITGLAQVRGRSCLSFDRIVRSDIQYIRQQSLKLDLLILWWTVLSVFSGDGAG